MNGKLTAQVRSIDSTDKPDGKNFWLPSHVNIVSKELLIKIGHIYPESNSKVVQMDIELMMSNIQLINHSKVSFANYILFCPRSKIPIP